MSNLGNTLLACINEVGRRTPKAIQRRIADFPGVLAIFDLLSRNQTKFVLTEEGFSLAINPLLHSNLLASGDLAGYEPELRRKILEVTRPGMVVYDIGANVGVFSFLFFSLVRRGAGVVYAFEPEPNNIACFERTLAKSGTPGVILCKQAVGRAPGTERFDRRGGAFSGRLVGPAESYAPTKNIALVETTSVDTLVLERGFRPPDIVKIDVEGNEGLVLEGMAKVLDQYHPMILCEVHTHLGDAGDLVLKILSSHGYSIAGLDGTPIDAASCSATNIPGYIVAVRP